MPTFNFKTTITLSAFFLIACLCSDEVEVEDLGPPPKTVHVEAISVINAGPPGRTVQGELHLTQSCPDYDVHIRGTITGLPPNSKHGFHIHQKGDLSDTNNPCLSTGAHYNPYNANHGAPDQPETHRHAGDLGNIESNADGVAHINIRDHIVQLCGSISVIGRAFVIHDMVDDLGTDGGDSLNTGNAGKRLACGLIGIVQPDILEVPDNKSQQ